MNAHPLVNRALTTVTAVTIIAISHHFLAFVEQELPMSQRLTTKGAGEIAHRVASRVKRQKSVVITIVITMAFVGKLGILSACYFFPSSKIDQIITYQSFI